MPVLAFALILAAAAPVPKAVKMADPFPTAVGTKWEYVASDSEKDGWVVGITHSEEKDGVITFRTKTSIGRADIEKGYTLAKGDLNHYLDNGVTYDPPILDHKAGATAGESWAVAYTSGENSFEGTFSAGKAEEITTPAGTFLATPITRKWKGVRQTEETMWYADGVGVVRTTLAGQTVPFLELKSFTRGGSKK
jgi:hypothetical protein